MNKTGPRLRLRLEFDGEHSIGPGKVQLLEAVIEYGSISAAARSMSMSYRHAWEMLDDVNRCFSGGIIETEAGGRSGGGARVTELGREVISQYHEISDEAQRAAGRGLQALQRARTDSRASSAGAQAPAASQAPTVPEKPLAAKASPALRKRRDAGR